MSKELIAITKRIDRLVRAIKSRKFFESFVDSIKNIEVCHNCGRVVMAKFKGICWVRKGSYQYGSAGSRIASWCSKKCEIRKAKNEL